MPDPVTDALTRLAAHRGAGFVIVADRTRADLYAQFLPAAEGPGLYAELVGNAHLPPAERLPPGAQAALRARGWDGDGDENWRRTFASGQRSLRSVRTAKA